MENKTNKVKWTKKFKALIISLSLAFAVALGGACTVLGLSLGGDKLRGSTPAGSVADDNTPAIPEAARTYSAGVTFDEVTYATNADAWAAAISYSLTNNAVVQFDLTKSWTADATTGFGTATETNSPYGPAGSLNVPTDAQIILNISEGVKLNRNVGSTAIASGSVVDVQGKLYLTGGGTVTGGNTAGHGGGVYVNAGEFTFVSGIIDGNLAQYGAGVFTANNTVFKMYGGSIANNTADLSGAGIFANGNVTMSGGSITNNTATTNFGGGIDLTTSGNFSMSAGTISDNKASNGGGIFSGGKITISGSAKISNNTAAQGNGGGIYNDAVGAVTVNGGEISGNKAISYGGGIYSVAAGVEKQDGTIETYGLTISGGTISGNNSTSSGGGVAVRGGTLTIKNGVELTGNNAGVRGGAIYAESTITKTVDEGTGRDVLTKAHATVNIESCDIYKNTSERGAAIFTLGANVSTNAETGNDDLTVKEVVVEPVTLNITDCNIYENKVSASVGAIYSVSTDMTVTGGNYYHNEAQTGNTAVIGINGYSTFNMSGDVEMYENVGGDGGCGALYLGGSYINNGVSIPTVLTANITGGIIRNNSTKGSNGGAIVVAGADVVANITNTQITNNSSKTAGGIYIAQAKTVTLTNVTISGNKSGSDGGGIYATACTLTLDGCILSNNTANGRGGGLYMTPTATVDVKGCTVSNNTATSSGGGIFATKAAFNLESSQILSNTAASHGGGLCVSGKGILSDDNPDEIMIFKDSTIKDNVSTAGCGGGACINAGTEYGAMTTKLINVTFDNNTGNENGGALWAGFNTLTIEGNSSFTNNKLENSRAGVGLGGAIYVTSSTVTINGTEQNRINISNNSGTQGGAIYGVRINCNYVDFSGNTAERGGAFFTESNNITYNSTFNQCRFYGNTASGNGGAIFASGDTKVTLNNSTIGGTGANQKNTAVNGGGIYNQGALELTGTKITGNTALNDGGGVYHDGSAFNIINTDKIEIKGNTAGQFTNNLYLRENKRIGLFDTITNSDADVGLSLETAGTEFIHGSTATILFNNNGTQKGYFPDNKDNYEIVQTITEGRYNYELRSKLGDDLASRWATAVNTSVSSKTVQLFELSKDWTATTSGSTTKFGAGPAEDTDLTMPFTCEGALCVPANANVVLDLKGNTLSRGLTVDYQDGGHVIVVGGTLTIKGSGTITGARCSGAIYVLPGGHLILNGGTITGNKAVDGGGVYIGSGSTFEMNGGSISGNVATTNGGGVFVAAGGEFIMNGGYIYDNTANGTMENVNDVMSKGGGGVYAVGGSFTLNGGFIGSDGSSPTVGNSAVGNGVGVLVYKGSFEMNGGQVSYNKKSSGSGAGGWGGIEVLEGTFKMTGGTVAYNDVTAGAVYIRKTTATLTGGNITSNTSSTITGGAGIIVVAGATVNIGENNDGEYSGNLIISNNKATGTKASTTDNYHGGGGIYVDPTSMLNLYSGKISGNISTTNGGGMLVWGTANIYGGDVTGNVATAQGAGIYVAKSGTLNMYGGNIAYNNAMSTSDIENGGAGVYVAGKFTMSGGAIKNNRSEDGTNNTTKAQATYGGGVYVAADGTFNLGTKSGSTLTGNGEIYSNYSSGDGGGAGIYSKGALNLNSGKIYSNNTVGDGGGVYLVDGTANMYSVKIYSNTAKSDGGGVAVYTGATFNMYGGKIYDNTCDPMSGNDNGANNSRTAGGVYVLGTFTMKSGEIYRNKSYFGGGVFASINSTVDIDGGEIYGNEARFGAGIGVRTTAKKLSIKGGEIYNNVAAVSGGGVFVEKEGTSTLNFTISMSANIHDNKAVSGGGVYVANATLTMTGGIISDNSVVSNTGETTGRGGGVYVAAGATFNLGKLEGTNKVGTGVISGNYAPQDGGGVYVRTETTATLGTNNATFNMYSGEVKENRSSYGAGVYGFGKASVINISGGTISKNAANVAASNGGGGLYVGYYAGGTMSGGTITENSATNSGGGGGVFISQNSKFTMTGGVISKNTSNGGGGGVYVYSTTSEFELKGTAKISENTAVNGGAGVYTVGTFTMDGSAEISGNTGGYGSGVLVSNGTFTLTNGKISENNCTAGSGAGVSVSTNGTFNMDGGEISGNTSALSGGGVYVVGEFNMTNGQITKNNTVNYAGGLLLNESGVLNMSGGSITDNTAEKGGGGVLIAFQTSGVINVSGNPVITGNTGVGKKVDNVSLQQTQVINISGVLNTAADIGVTISNNGKRVFTSGLASSGLSHPNVVFSADNKKLVVGVSDGEATLLDCVNINLTLYDKDGNLTDTTAVIKVDAGEGEKVTYTLSDDKSKYTFTSTQGGRTGVTTVVNVPVVAGYTPYIYNPADGNSEVASGTGALDNVTTDKDLCIGYRANTNTAYTVYYILQQVDGSYTNETRPTELNTMTSVVKKYTGSGTTDQPLTYKDEDGKALATFENSQHYSYDSIVGDTNINGDGSTYVLVYMKLNEYTVSFTAPGATNGMQKKSFKYGATLTFDGLKVPTKDMNEFEGWYTDAACTEANKVYDKKTDAATKAVTVTADMTLYAKFTTKSYTLVFDLNVGTDKDKKQLDTSLVLSEDAALWVGNKVKWDTATLFPAANNFGFKEAEDDYAGTGKYQITYNVNNVSANKNLLGTRPSAIGFRFLGWFASETATSQTQTIRKPAVNTADVIVLTARWEPAQYAIQFDYRNGDGIEIIEPTNLTPWKNIVPEEPTYAGYIFDGWYTTLAAAKDSENNTDIFLDSSISEEGNEAETALFSIYDFGPNDESAALYGAYGNAANGYDFNGLKLYAGWKSVGVRVNTATGAGVMPGTLTYKNSAGGMLTTTMEVAIGAEITVEIKPNPGYNFTSLTVGKRVSTAEVTETTRDGAKIYVTKFTIQGGDTVEGGVNNENKPYKIVYVSATFTEERYSITYNTDGGKVADDTISRTYGVTELDVESLSRVKLPSLLTKRGYIFAGWSFVDDDGKVIGDAFDKEELSYDDETGYKGADIYLIRPETLGKITLKAKWDAQASQVYLYNANYDQRDYDYDSTNKRYLIANNEHKLTTDMEIEIINPSRGETFVFMGWATSRNGVVVYPADAGKNTVTYVVNAHMDENGNLLNRNNLYAVWQVAGVNYIVMSANNNGTTYGGEGITMSAKTARTYSSDETATIKLDYTWYKIYEGHYDECFDEVDYVDSDNFKLYVDADNNVVAYEKDGEFYDTDKTTKITKAQAEDRGSKLTYKEFNATKALAGNHCEVKTFTDVNGDPINTKNLTPEETCEVSVRNVNDCGVYICVVGVKATGEGSNSEADGYGEIEITMNKAEYDGVDISDTTASYNTAPRYDVISIKNSAGVDPTTTDASGIKYLTLPDGSRLIVTYKYFVGTGEARTEITDLTQVKAVGTYHVTVSFAFTPDGDKGNYELPETMDADLIIVPDTISNQQFEFVHGETKITDTTKFQGPYDGDEYKVVATILDTTGIGTNPPLVTKVDDVAFDVKVYRVTDTGEAVEVTGPTTEAGSYYLQIVGLTGEDSANYALGSGLTLRADYTIGKKAYDVAGKISFDDATETFDNELHTISITVANGYSIPEDEIEVVYKTNYLPEAEDFDKTDYRLDNYKDNVGDTPITNGGRYAGVYTVTVEFKFKTEAAKNNYAALDDMSATLTIKKAEFFEFYNTDGVDLLRDAGFVNAAHAYTVGEEYHPYISNSKVLNDTDHFSLSYEYYRVTNETTGERTLLASGTHAELVAQGDIISLAGKYEIVARIKYESALYRNNFEEIDEAKYSTITYVIRAVDVESVEVIWQDVYDESDPPVKIFDKVTREVSLGAGFNYKWIEKINVRYVNNANPFVVTREADIALAGIKLEQKNNVDQTTFWKVGDFNVIVSFYGKDSEAYNFKVKETIADVQVRYNTDGSDNYTDVTEDGIEYNADATYYFIVAYKGTNTLGDTEVVMTSTATAAEALKLGSNKLNVTEANYVFGDITVNMYKVVGGEDITWQYKLGNGEWENIPESHELTYAGAEYKIRASFDDNGPQEIEAEDVVRGVSDYVISIGRSGNYKLTADLQINVVPLVINVTWSSSELKYNTYHQTPVVATSNRAAADEGLLDFEYEFTDKDGKALTAANVVNVGEYVAKLVLTGEASGNYTLVGSTTAEQAFKITQADIEMTAIYSEYNYGANKTYAGNPQGLRLDAMKADFGEKAAIEGDFAFITNYNAATGKYDIADGASLKTLIANINPTLQVRYVYIPKYTEDKLNYKEKIGLIELDVQKQVARSGAGALSVEFGEDAVQFYLVNQEFDTHGIEVYLLYQSTYEEDGEWYGLRDKRENVSFRIGSMVAQGYKITSQDLSSEKVVLRAISGSYSGTLDVPVVDKVADKLEVSSTDHKKVYYVGEKFDFGDMTFKVTFNDEAKTSQDGLKKGSIKADFTGIQDYVNGAFTVAGEKQVTFTYFGKPCYETFTVKDKEELQIIEPTNLVLTYRNGETLTAPQLKAVVDGVTYTQSEFDKIGVSVRVEVTYKSNSQAAVLGADKEGLYNVRYIFTVTNPRFNRPANINKDVRVTENPYQVSIDVPTSGLSAPYAKEYISIPKPTIGNVIDTTDGNKVVPESYLEKIFTVTYKGTPERVVIGDEWHALHAGVYVIDIVVNVKPYKGYGEYEAGRASYEFTVTKAENDPANIKLTVPSIVLLGSVENFNFKVEADFGAEKAVLKYSKTGMDGWTTEKPTEAGRWFVRAEIAEDTEYGDYTGVTSEVIPFNVRKAGTEADITGEGSVEGSITGSEGVEGDWKLTIKESAVDDVNINKQTALYGYNVSLVDKNGVAVKASGEYTLKIKLSAEQLEALNGKTIRLFSYDAEGKATEIKAEVKDGNVEFKTTEFGRFVVTEAIPKAAGVPVGLIVGVSLGAVAAAGMIAAVIIVFLKKKRGNQ